MAESDLLLERPDPPQEEETPSENDRDTQLANKLEELKKDVRSQQAITKLMEDPDIRAILTAKQQGKKVKVSLDDEEVKTPVTHAQPEKDLEEMSNTELMTHLMTQLSPVLENVVTSKLKPISDSLAQVTGHLQSQQNQSVAAEIERVRGQYEDFDTYQQEMVQLNGQNPGLGVEELYLIAKRRKSGSSATPKVSSERPSSVPSRGGSTRDNRKLPAGSGRQGFRDLLEAALDRTPFQG